MGVFPPEFTILDVYMGVSCHESTDKQERKTKPTVKLGIWNFCTMTTDIDTDINNTSDARKTAIINIGLFCLKIYIAVSSLRDTHCWSNLHRRKILYVHLAW